MSLAYDSLHGLGLMAESASVPFNLRGTVSGVKVAVIGGGLAGLTVACELEKLGYTRMCSRRGRARAAACTRCAAAR